MSIVNKLLSLLGIKKTQLPYWIEIKTQIPSCIYYFGPFDNQDEAKSMQSGYIEDLMAEKAEGISAEIKQCQPKELTIFDE